ncbi:MAG: six-cysteine ranthipeptide SCIFF [Anaerovoracaceae bacterium]
MSRIKTIATRNLKDSLKTGGCGECQTSCQSASKTSCSVANQQCEQCKEK